ncbi:WD40 repeat-like protein, partial [Agrocybe pediades]
QWNTIKDYGKIAWKATETALRLLEKNADGFPPLKTAVSALVTCLDLAKDVIGNQEEYAKLADEFKEMASSLAPHASKLAASDEGSIALILKSIDEELVKIKHQLERGKFKRTIKVTDDQGDILDDVTLRTHVEIGKLREATDATLLRTLAPVHDARYNSAYSTAVKRRGCTASTREQILDDLRAWVSDPQSSKVFWMNGMAGTGKTTIMYSFCEWLEENKRLAGNFFCNRASTSCRDLSNIVRSVAYQLSHYSPAFRSQLCKILEEKQNPHMLNVGEQFKWVVETPFQDSKDAIPDGAVIVIDALDECDNVSATALFLKVLLQYSTHLPIKFLVASRPEPVIVEKMQAPGFSPSVLRLHDIEQSFVEADIRQFLREALCTMSPVPSSDVIDQLTLRSGKLFIYAATVARYVNPEGVVVNSQTRLEQELDSLYTGILLSAFDKGCLEEGELEIVALVLRTVVCAIEPMATSTMSMMLALGGGDVSGGLSRLESVLHVQEGSSGLVSVLHASFPDFLCDEARSRDFYCDIAEHSTRLAHSCFNVMCQELHFNICDLESSYDFDEDVPDLEQKIRANISAALLYACKYWSRHLVHCDLTSSIHYRLVEFLKFRFLFWMEVLNLTKSISTGSQMLSSTLAWFISKAPEHVFKETEKELYDAELFVKMFSLGACKKSTPHIYISALPFCFKSSSVYQNYWSKTSGLMEIGGTSLNRQRNGLIGAWKTHRYNVGAVAFSPDGSTFAAGYNDRVNIREVQSGEIVFSSLLEDRARVMSLVFSPDNSKIATLAENRDIWVWDIQTANLIGTLWNEQGRLGRTPSLVFSWDSNKLASYSHSVSTMVVWNLSSCRVLSGPFETKDLGSYGSFTFTRDDSKILFVQSNLNNAGMVHVLDVRTGSNVAAPFKALAVPADLETTAISVDTTMVDTTIVAGGDFKGVIYVSSNIHSRTIIHHTFVGHRTSVSALAFSRDGKKLVSGSVDGTIRIWEVGTGNLVAGSFEGHLSAILSLGLSSDGTKLMSSAGDKSVRLWDVFANDTNIAPPCQSIASSVSVVAWSPDCTTIASGQNSGQNSDSDGTVAVWSAHNGEFVIGPFYCQSPILAIAFSPDSSRISAGTKDGTVTSWDLKTGEMVFQGHSGRGSRPPCSIVYSPDGSIMVYDLFVWNCSTGEMIGKVRGHDSNVESIPLSLESNRLVLGAGDGESVYVWDVASRQFSLCPIWTRYRSELVSVACSLDGTQFVSGFLHGKISALNITTAEVPAGRRRFGSFGGPVESFLKSVTFSGDGTKIIAAYTSANCAWKSWNPIYIFDAETGDNLVRITGHTEAVISFAASPDGSRFVSGSSDKSLRVWRLDALLQEPPTIWMDRLEDVEVPTILEIPNKVSRYEADGWVMQDNLHVFWTSPEFREDLCFPYNPITIGPHGSTCIDYSPSKLFIGRMWSKCWIHGHSHSSVNEEVE